MKDYITKAANVLELGAKALKDKGNSAYSAQHHAALCGMAMAQAVKDGMEPNASNMAALFHAIYNHSQWRQKFERDGIFPKAESRAKTGLDNLLAELSQEGITNE